MLLGQGFGAAGHRGSGAQGRLQSFYFSVTPTQYWRAHAPCVRRLLMENMWSSMKIATNRRSFLENGLTAAGAATAGMGLLANSSSAFAEDDEGSGRLSRG